MPPGPVVVVGGVLPVSVGGVPPGAGVVVGGGVGVDGVLMTGVELEPFSPPTDLPLGVWPAR